MDVKEMIHQCPLFSGLTDEDLSELIAICRTQSAAKGEVLFSQGDTAQGFFIVATGKVKIYKLSPDGKERILHIIQPGGNFAEAAIFGDGLYPAFAEPLVPSELLFFPRDQFLRLLHERAGLAINMIGGLSRFLRLFATQIEELTFKDVPARLARYILNLAEEQGEEVCLPISKTQLASNLGTVSETLSRSLRKMSDEDLIEVQGKIIRILDEDRLEELAEKYREI